MPPNSDTVSASQAQRHFAELLTRVEHGESIVITRRGIAIAKLVPAQIATTMAQRRIVIQEMRSLAKTNTLGRLSLRSLIRAGRR